MSALDIAVGLAVQMLDRGFAPQVVAAALRRPVAFVVDVASGLAIVRAERAS